jgi:hypothetical protein
MFVPAAAEDLTFPEQKLQYWSAYEANQWLRAGQQFTTGSSFNGVGYTAATQIHTGFGNVGSVTLADNGKLYIQTYTAGGRVAWLDTYNDTTGSVSTNGSNNGQGTFYSPITKNVYMMGDGNTKVVSTLSDTITATITHPFTGQTQAGGISFDGRYAYGNGFFANKKIVKLDLFNNTAVSTSVSTYTGDPLRGTLAVNNKFYFGAGGGSTAGTIVYDPVADSIAYTNVGSVSDQIRDYVQYYDGFVYSYPGYGNTAIKRINLANNTFTNVKTGLFDGRYCSLTIGADGCIYGVGNTNGTNRCLQYNPRTNYSYEETIASTNYNAIIMGAQGDLYLFGANGICYKKSVLNNGRVLKPLAEFNGITSRLQTV